MSNERRVLNDYLQDTENADLRLTEVWSVTRAWREGKRPTTAPTILQWAIVLQRGKRRAQRLIAACDALTGILLVQYERTGASNRSAARALGLKPTQAHDLKVKGREIVARGRIDDGVPPAGPVSSDPSS